MGHIDDGRGEREPLDRPSAQALSATLQALASPTRLLILDHLRHASCTVGDLTEAIGMEQPAVSQQLRVLRNLGLVVGERQGRVTVYDLYDDHVAALIDQAIYHVEHLHSGARGTRRGNAVPVSLS